MNEVEKTYLRIIKTLHQDETINLLVKNKEMRERKIELMKRKGIQIEKINLFIYDYADVWFRDYGPIFIVDKNRRLAMTHWTFNAWGGKYESFLGDTNIPEMINKMMKLPYFKPGIILEGGSIDVNGKGTLITTEQCLLNKNRNKQLSKHEIEQYLKDYLGIKHIVWLKSGIVGDDTDGHVDDIARFVNPTTVLCAYEEDENDENHSALKENYEILLKAKDQDGKPLKIIKLPMPGIVEYDGSRLPASYANFYIGNTAVLVPIFGHNNDSKALEIISKALPDRKIVGIDCKALVYGMGTIHCISQQQPSINSE
jgi:agmatine deiminase